MDENPNLENNPSESPIQNPVQGVNLSPNPIPIENVPEVPIPKAKKKKKDTWIIIIALIVLAGVTALAVYLLTLAPPSAFISPDNVVTRVIDGDTFVLASGDIVRLICVDTPELGANGSEEAATFLSDLVLGKVVRLENDTDDKDAYDRLLRYVYVNDTFVNKEIVKNKLGTLFPYGNDTAKCNEIGQ